MEVSVRTRHMKTLMTQASNDEDLKISRINIDHIVRDSYQT